MSWPTITGLLGLRDVLVILGVQRRVRFERVERKYHIFGCHRLTVMPLCEWTQPVGGGRDVFGIAQTLCEQAIVAIGFIERWNEQRVVDLQDARSDRAFHLGD